jgi:glycerol kinase
MTAILALDQGTTGSTALLVSESGAVLGRGYREISQHYPHDGWVEQDPLEIRDASAAAIRDALAVGKAQPVALGITNQRETIVLWSPTSSKS